MLDTADKRIGSLFDRVDDSILRRFVARVHGSGAMVGIAGALRVADVPRVAALAPTFAGFRSAVCAGGRESTLNPARLQALREAMTSTQGVALV
jgi:uncharacterized protein (UPF0264 family)